MEQLRNRLAGLKESFWFLPAMMTVAAVLLSFARVAPSPEHKQALLMHARMVENAGAEHLKERVDIEALEARVAAVIEALEAHQQPAASQA